jgi:queuosine precursor transporter
LSLAGASGTVAISMKLDARLRLFVTLVAVFVTCLVVGDMTGGKLSSVYLFDHEWRFSVGLLAFPVTFILTDVLNEFYGQKVTRQVTYLAFAMVGLTFAIIYASAAMPWSAIALDPEWKGVTPQDFDVVFTQATRIQMASMVAFLTGNLIDIWAFHAIKKVTGERFLWLRSTGSTAISQMVDTIVINALVWGTKVTFSEYVTIVIASYVIKLVAAIVVTPIIYALHTLLEKRFGIEPDHATDDEATASQ